MSDTDLMLLQDRVTAAREAWREAYATGTDEQEAAAYKRLRRLESALREAVIERTRAARVQA